MVECHLPARQMTIIKLLRYGYKLTEAEEYYGVPHNTFRTWFNRGKFTNKEAAVIGRECYIFPEAIERVMRDMSKE